MKNTPAPSWSRRRLLKTVFCSSAALSLNVGRGRVSAAEASAEGDMHWLAIGDFGSQEPAQEAVARGMRKYAADLKLKTEGLLLLGDNFYSKMEGGIDSKRWKAGFEDMYPASAFPGPCVAVLGNHDYHDNPGGEQAQLGYAKRGGTRWTMPSKWFRLDFPKASPLVTFICIDSNLRAVSGGTNPKDGKKKNSLTKTEEDEQLAWLAAELEKPRAPWTICIGHHPIYSNGQHGDTKALIKDFAPLLQKHAVPVYLCGHDHDLQHLEFEGHPTSFVISGGGGAKIREPKQMRGPFAKGVYGFTHLEVTAEKFIVRHVDPDRKVLHAFAKKTDGSWMEV